VSLPLRGRPRDYQLDYRPNITMETSPSLGATKTCQAASWRRSDTTDRRLLCTVAQSNQASDIWVRADVEVEIYIIFIDFYRLSFNGEEERRNRQHFRCFRILWYIQLKLFPRLLLKAPSIKGHMQWVISQMKSGSMSCDTPAKDPELVAACLQPTQ
jgi:hypothetical protein